MTTTLTPTDPGTLTPTAAAGTAREQTEAMAQIAAILAANGLTAADLAAATPTTIDVAGYVGKFLPTVSGGSLRAYGTYLRRFADAFAGRSLGSITTTELKGFVMGVQRAAVEHRGHRRTSRDGRSAAESAITGLRALYRRAADDGLVTSNPAMALRKPARPRRTRTPLTADQLTELFEVTRSGGDDPELDTLLVRFLVESGARREGLLALRLRDIDPTRATVLLREKNDKDGSEQPLSPTLIAALRAFAANRGATSSEDAVFRYRPRRMGRVGQPLTSRRFDTLSKRWNAMLSFAAHTPVTAHVLRHTAIGLVEIQAGYAVAREFARHVDQREVTTTYLQRSIADVAAAVEALTGEPHPLATQRWNFGG